MISWQITDIEELNKINVTEDLEQVDDLKIKITKCFITLMDINVYSGLKKQELPYTPGKFAVGQITELLSESNYFQKGQKVYLTINGNDEKEGFLKEFAVVNKESCHVLPNNVSEYDALFVNHLSLALSVIDKLKIDKGDYVAVVGGSILGNLIAQLLSYYKAVPILLDSDEDNVELAKKSGIYYSLSTNANYEKEAISITGGKMCDKVIYVNDSDLSFDTAIKLTAKGGSIAVAGITETNKKLNLNSAYLKGLNIRFILASDDNIDTAINLLVQKAVTLSLFKLNDYKFDYISKQFENASLKLKNDNIKTEFTVDLL